jgi:hypothetical protein
VGIGCSLWAKFITVGNSPLWAFRCKFTIFSFITSAVNRCKPLSFRFSYLGCLSLSFCGHLIFFIGCHPWVKFTGNSCKFWQLVGALSLLSMAALQGELITGGIVFGVNQNTKGVSVYSMSAIHFIVGVMSVGIFFVVCILVYPVDCDRNSML